MRVAHSRHGAGDRHGAAQAMERAIALATGADRRDFEQQRELLQIDDDIHAGRKRQAAERLAAVMAGCRARGQTVLLRHRPDVAACLADLALESAIEADYVRALVGRNKLAPPPGASHAWPFRLRVHVLGRFELVRDGQTMRFSGKTQQRPLDLLKVVVALGGEAVDSQQVTAALWPDADGAAAKSSFDVALFRLRKLLEIDQVISLTGGKLSLSAAIVWTDVRALDEATKAAIEATQRVEASDSGLRAVATRLVDAYPGTLLANDEGAWIAKPRDALRARFMRAVTRLGEHLERGGDWSGAIDLYRRGLEADNLAEPFYRGLMRSLAATGEKAEALNAYRRCRDLLSIVLGLKPAGETERLHRQIADDGTALGQP
jgi:DNA-binding SARP family transcriptional activator